MLLAAVSLLLVGAVLWHVDLKTFAVAFKSIGLGEIAVLVGVYLAVISVTALRLFCTIRYFTDGSISFLVAVRACIAGLLSSLVVVNFVGNIAGRQLVLMEGGVPVSITAATALLERVLIACLGCVLMLFGWAWIFSAASLWSVVQQMALPQITLCILATPVAIAVLFRWKREVQLMRDIVSKAFAARLATLIAVTALGQMLTISSFVIAGLAFDIGVDTASLMAAGAVISFAAALPISVNGWGVREIAAIFTFGELGVSAPDSLALSVTVGLASTAAVLLVAPLLNLRIGRPVRPPDRHKADQTGIAPNSSAATTTAMLGERNAIKGLAMALGPAIGVLLFYRMHVAFGETLISINLGDPLAIFAFALVGSLALYKRHLVLDLPRAFLIWLAVVTLTLLLSFLIGVADFGTTSWALNNRLIGWLVLLGYCCTGALWVTFLGAHGLRRLTETLLIAAAIIAVVTVTYYEFGVSMYQDRPLWNLEGFSLNRNSFAFELNVTLAAALAFSPVMARSGSSRLFVLLCAIIMFAIWRTYSNTGVITMAVLVLSMFAFRVSDRRMTAYAVMASIGVFGCVFFAHTLSDILTGRAVGAGFSGNFYFPDGIERPSFYLGTSLAERWGTIKRGFEIWLENPFFGAGLGYFVNMGLTLNGERLVIHSTPVWLLAEFGVIGTAVIISLPVAYCIKLMREPAQLHAKPNNFLFPLLLCFALFSLPHDIVYQRIFWFVLGGAVALFPANVKTLRP